MFAGSTFTKCWVIRNSGTSAWTGDFFASRSDGSYGPSTIPLSGSVSAGGTTSVCGSFQAPGNPNTYRSTYRMRGPRGPFGDSFWVQVIVDARATVAPPTVQPASTPIPTLAPSTSPPVAVYDIPQLLSPSEGATVQPNQLVTFAWSGTGAPQYKIEVWNDTGAGSLSTMVNGTSTQFAPPSAGSWRWQVRSVRSDGQPGDAPHTRSFSVYSTTPTAAPAPVATCSPGAGVTLYADANFQGSCHTYGPGEYSNLGFGLDGIVSSIGDSGGAYHVTLFDQPGLVGTPGYFDSDTASLSGYWNDRARSLRVEAHSGAPSSGCSEGVLGTSQTLSPTPNAGTTFSIFFELQSSGSCVLGPGQGYALEFASGDQLGAPASIALTDTVTQGNRTRFNITMTAPSTPGEYLTRWSFHHNGRAMADLAMVIQVNPAQIVVTPSVGIPTCDSTTVGLWALNEGSGATVADACHRSAGSASGGSWTSGLFNGSSLAFNGHTTVTIADDTAFNLTRFTLEAYLYVGDANNPQTVVRRDDAPDRADHFYLGTRGLDVEFKVNGRPLESSRNALTPNAWNHMAGTYDGTTMRLYVNGRADTTSQYTDPVLVGSGPVFLGYNRDGSDYLNGRLQYVRISSGARTQFPQQPYQ